MKKLLSFVIILIFLLVLTSCFSFPNGLINKDSNKSKAHFKYTLNDQADGYVVSYLVDNPTYDHLQVPDTYEGLPVTEIKEIYSSKVSGFTTELNV